MRNFEERKAEVFRRSENRIKERKKKRNHILSICIPLCLIFTVCSVTVLPTVLGVKTGNTANDVIGHTSKGAADAGGTDCFVSVSVEGTGYHSKITEPSKVKDVYEQLHTIFTLYESHNDTEAYLSDGSGAHKLYDNFTSADTMAKSYIITMISGNGTERTLTLTDDKIYDSKLNIEIELTDEQLKNLKLALELTE